MKPKRKALILCTGNSCRSIMAEALINHHLSDSWQAFSAGVEPLSVNPRAIQVMAEIGVDISSSRSKSINEFIKRDDLDLVITVCDNARETCPVFSGPVQQIHIGIDDPAPFTAYPDDQALPKFRQARDIIKEKLLGELRARL
ncbi:MAG: arsenate reductase ArsC [candidate division Zixibacteria bacterium]|nr:arsenate reductase ArsC [candidate division Zixibacteria bacterium]